MPRHTRRPAIAPSAFCATVPPVARALHQQRIVQAACLGALLTVHPGAWAADIDWISTTFGSNQWVLPAAWAGGVRPGAGDRAVFNLTVAGALNNRAIVDTNLEVMGLGAVQINATSTVTDLGTNESQRIVHLYGLGGVGGRNEGTLQVRFFKFTELQGSLAIQADNAAGGGFNFNGGITPVGVPGHAGVTLNGHTLTLDTVHAANLISFNGSAGITGAGNVIKLGAGRLQFAGDASRNNYTGSTSILGGTLALLGGGSIAASRHLEIGASGVFDISGTTAGASIQNLGGSGAVLLGAQNLAITAASGAFNGVISGTGNLRIASGDRFVLGGANTHSGGTQVDSGTLVAGVANAFSAASAHTVAAGAGLDLAGFSHQLPALSNAGTVSLAGASAGTTLTVAGPYVSNGGAVRLGTGASVSDRLVLDGAAATPVGQTQLQIVPLPGMGVATTGDGIEVVSALNGASTTAQTTRDGFSLAGGHVDSGAYEYRLYAADAAGAGESWFLRSTVRPGAAAPEVPAYRQEVPLLAAAPQQLRHADQAMLGNLHLREGSAPNGAQRQAWVRLISTDRISSQAGTVSPDSEGRLNGLQAGTHLWGKPNWSAGVYVGRLEGDARVSGFASGVHGAVGQTDLRSEYLGVYATHRRDSGFYVDGVLQGARHRAALATNASGSARLKGRGLLASVELGQPFALGSGWLLEPQLQLLHQRLNVDDTALSGETTVRHDSDSGWTLRLGARLQGELATGLGQFKPYGRVNLFTGHSGTDLAGFGATSIATRTGGTSTELAVGGTLALSRQLSVYGELGQLWAAGGAARSKSGPNASLGLKLGW